MKKLYTLVLFGCLVFCMGCASTKITAFVDPEYYQAQFQKILVVANTDNLANRKYLEDKMTNILLRSQVYAIESYKLFPPTRELTQDDKIQILIDNNIDAYISMTPEGEGVHTIVIPPKKKVTTTGIIKEKKGITKYKEETVESYVGGSITHKPWAKFETVLYDAETGQKAWLAISYSEGSQPVNIIDEEDGEVISIGLSDRGTVITSYCKKVASQLIRDKLLARSILY